MRLLPLFLVLMVAPAHAVVLSASSMEIKFNYTAEFQTRENGEGIGLIDTHAQHLFGLFQSPGLVEQYRLHAETGGVAAPKLPIAFQIVSDRRKGGVRTIQYRASGLLLVNKKAARRVLAAGEWAITMPFDLDAFFDEKCTDEHYNTLGDFWYFYDPYRQGCSHLREAPLAKDVILKVKEAPQADADASASFADLRGDNGNGELFEIVTINGFSEDATNRRDEGRVSFGARNKWLRAQGFQETQIARYDNRPVYRYEKTVTTREGRDVLIRFTRLLAETSVTSKNVTFAKFFKTAVEGADVVIYAGHSGLGGNLDIAALEEKAGKFEFNAGKKQLFFFDGCSTYSYFLSVFEERKTKGKIDIMTNGLSSYFHTEGPTHDALYRSLLDPNADPKWSKVLKDMEDELGGSTYMLNVGPI